MSQNRVRTEQSCYYSLAKTDGHIISAFKNLEYEHRSLQHQYANLDHEFQIYSAETLNKISSLEEGMDLLVEEKDRKIRNLELDNENLKSEKFHLQNKIQNFEQQISNFQSKLQSQSTLTKNSEFSLTKLEEMYEEKIQKLEEQISLRTAQSETIKQILNNEHISCISKDELIRSRENQISRLRAELASTDKEIQESFKIQQNMKNVNFELKKEVEELKTLFIEVENGLNNCENCFALRYKNQELTAIIQQYERNQLLSRNHKPASQSNNLRKQKYSFSSSYYIPETNHKMKHYRNTTIRQFGDSFVSRQNSQCKKRTNSTVKQSILDKCRSIIDD